MDFPHSVPNVALLNGRFTDGNPLVGIQASRDPAAWANAVTDELLNVIRAADMTPAEAEVDQLLRGINTLIARKVPNQQILSFSASEVLEANQMGLILLDAAGGSMTVELPVSDTALGVRDVILRRTDNTGNRLVIQTTGNDRIKFHTHLRTEGYPFLVLMGAGDYWHLRSDGEGSWWPVARRDDAPVGSYRDTAGAIIPPGGYGLPTGTVQAAHYPWLADYAQQSGALVAVGSRTAKDGRWSITGDGTTIYLPSPESAFRRPHDPSSGRGLGTYQGDAIRNITGSMSGVQRNGASVSGVFSVVAQGGGYLGSNAGRTDNIHFNASTVVPTADENRPENITAYPLLKLI